MHAKPVFRFLEKQAHQGQPTALVTVTSVAGASTRNPGTHMGVSEAGFVGSLSGGCIEQAVVAEALDCIRTGMPRSVRFGAGSPYIDIRLPCGGSIDLLINPIAPTDSFVSDTLALMEARQMVKVRLPTQAGRPEVCASTQATPAAKADNADPTNFIVIHPPGLRIIILGHGASVDALRQQAVALGVEIRALSPDQAIVDAALENGAEAARLTTPAQSPHLEADRWTAVIFYFHDHDWEGQLLAQALESQAFFVGAMGSRKTHAARLEQLETIGVEASDRARIVSPIGLIPSSRDPETLALSTLAQVVEAYHERLRRQD